MAMDGKYRTFYDRAYMLYDETGWLYRMSGAMQDITQRKVLENSLAEERLIRQKQITDAVITGQEKERSQLGEELHDNINQILATTRLYIECAVSEEHPRPDLVIESKVLLEKAMTEIRKLSKTLLPPSLGEIGLVDALDELIDSLNETSSLQIENGWKGFAEDTIDDKLKLTIFRIVQEQMSNVSKHSQATKATISLQQENGSVILKITDNGIGFNPSLKRSGLGLRNMTSRAEVNNGTLTIESQPGAGCQMTVVFK
jgi:two-component system sensor histidine kinase UhpB